jgi:predicted nucleic acid-binding protein
MANLTVLYDACVLYPQNLRDLLMHIASTDLVKAKWSPHIHEEWIRNLHQRKPDIPLERLYKVRELMDSYVEDSVVTGYEPLIETLSLPDEDDRHVLAAAIVGRADLIITNNIKDFPPEYLQKFKIEAVHPDKFISDLFDLNPLIVCECVRRQRNNLKKPPRSVDEHLSKLEANSLTETVKRLRDVRDNI